MSQVPIASPVKVPGDAVFLLRAAMVRGRRHFYQVYLPPGYSSRRPWPLVLFLHGSGERGRDGLRQTQVGLAPAMLSHRERFPAIAVFPQAPPDQSWDTADMERLVTTILQRTCEKFPVDERRLYLTGLSMGGYGVWHLASRHPGRFAALVPVCGGLHFPAAAGGDPNGPENIARCAEYASRIRSTPVWIFHGGEDPVVPVHYARNMARALAQCGYPPRYTEYPRAGHDIWDRAYAEPELALWLFAQVRAR